jgi:hypothetical protein
MKTTIEVRPLRFIYCASLAFCAFSWGGWPAALFVLLAGCDVDV